MSWVEQRQRKAEPYAFTGLEPWAVEETWGSGVKLVGNGNELVPCSDWDCLKVSESHGRFQHKRADIEGAGIIAVTEG